MELGSTQGDSELWRFGIGGFVFEPKWGAAEPVAAPWSAITRLEVRHSSRPSLAALLDADLTSGHHRTWLVSRYRRLGEALKQIAQSDQHQGSAFH
jgi:hypothetical protein